MSKSVLVKRFLWILGICAIQSLYFPINLWMTGGIAPRTSLDIFPIVPIWVLPYLLCFPLWLFSLVWIILKMDDRTFKAIVAAFLLTLFMAVSTFMLFPTYVAPPKVISAGIFADLLRSVNIFAGGYNALPSGHVYITTLIALFFRRYYPSQKWAWMGVVLIVSLSTLYTGQHYIVDVFGGLLVALIGFHFGLWWAGLLPASGRIKRSGVSLLHPR